MPARGSSRGARRIAACRALAAAAFLLLLPACSTVSLPLLPGGYGVSLGAQQVLVESTSAYGWGYLSHPFAGAYGTRGILVSYNLAGDTIYAQRAPQELAGRGPAYSTDAGATWAIGGKVRAALGPGVLMTSGHIPTPEGTLLFSQNGWNEKSGTLVFTCQRWRDGVSNEPPYRCEVAIPQVSRWWYLSNRGVVTPDGLHVLVGYGTSPTGGLYSTVALGSTNGRAWSVLSVVAGPKDATWGIEGPSEPAIACRTNGELVVIMRTGEVRLNPWQLAGKCSEMLEAVSADHGRTWTLRRMTRKGVMPKLIPMSNGVWVLAYGRPGNMIALSRDEGRHWREEIAVSPMSMKTSGYLDGVEVAPDELLFFYDAHDYQTRKIWLWEPPPPANAVLYKRVTIRP